MCKKKYNTVISLMVSFLVAAGVNANESNLSNAENDRSSSNQFDLFQTVLSGAQEVIDGNGDVETDLKARAFAAFNADYSRMNFKIRFNTGSDETIVAMHFHCGAAGQNGPLALGIFAPGPLSLDGNQVLGKLTNDDVLGMDCQNTINRPVNNLVSLAQAMREGLIYLNVHSQQFPGGVVRGQMKSEYVKHY